MKPIWQAAPADLEVRQDEAHVWFCNFSEVSDFADGSQVLSEAEQNRADRFKTEDSKLTYIGSHIFLRRVLGSCLPIPASAVRFSVSTGGKPCLDQLIHATDLQFNLSHSQRSAACIIARGTAVGIDLERSDPELCDDDTARQVFGQEELHYLNQRGQTERTAAFFRGWTKKEAYAKCKGTGLSSDLAALTIGCHDAESVFGGVSLLSFRFPNGYAGALAIEGPSVPVSYWTMSPQRLINLT
ncbi:MAG: 4'-phosphopantetheinyl transferase superfamily protein [Terriglobia bacterium]|jgi:4'-phosphopantetheinyl transferase|nr:4'-phosphopantetheinyl transferase superfamily protein [Terriglobia bacterium]